MLTRIATKNQLLGQLDRSFPGRTLALPDVLGTKVGRLVATHFADPTRLTALGSARFLRFAAARDVQVRQPIVDRLLVAARDALPNADAAVARAVLATDLALFGVLDERVTAAEQLAPALPDSPYAALTSVPGWATVRVGNYGAAVGTHTRGQGPDRSIALRGCPRCSTSLPGSAVTGRSAKRAAPT